MGWFNKKKDTSENTQLRPMQDPSESKRKKPKVWGIKKAMINFIIEASKDSYPNEFYAKLLQKKGIIIEFSIIRTIQGDAHAIPFTHMEPPDIFLETAGTVHSHPSGSNLPSEADLEFFAKMGDTHIIIGYPYSGHTWQAYNRSGEPIELKVVRRTK